MSFEDDIKKMEEDHRAEKELFRAKEWFWREEVTLLPIGATWFAMWGDHKSSGYTNTEALLNAYRKAQEMEGAE